MSARAKTASGAEKVQRYKSCLLLLAPHLPLAFFLSSPLLTSCSISARRSTKTMAVRGHYLSNVLFQSRDETEINNKEMMDMNLAPPLFEQSHAFFSSYGENVNRWKRGREAAPSMTPSQQQFVFSLQSPVMFDPSPVRSQASTFVSTGLHLALAEHSNRQIREEQPDSIMLASFLEEIAAQINKDDNEIDQYFIAEMEQLRRSFAKRRQRHNRTLLEVAEKKLLEKEAEIERARRYISDLEGRLIRVQTELMAWQGKAMAEQAAVESLHSQLQKATVNAAAATAAAGKENCGESPAEDAESVYIDPNRSEKPERPCRACHRRPAIVVLIPCCHLCLCVSCDFVSSVGDPCPACGCFRTGSLQVSFA